MAEHKASYEAAEQEYQQHKEQINTIAEEADSKKVNGLVEMPMRLLTICANGYSARSSIFYPQIAVPNTTSKQLSVQAFPAAAPEELLTFFY